MERWNEAGDKNRSGALPVNVMQANGLGIKSCEELEVWGDFAGWGVAETCFVMVESLLGKVPKIGIATQRTNPARRWPVRWLKTSVVLRLAGIFSCLSRRR